MNAKKLKELRKVVGLTQDQLAEMIGVTRKTIINYENGGVIPDSKVTLLEMVLTKNVKQSDILEFQDRSVSNSNSSVWVPYYDLDFSGGWTSDEISTEQKPSFFITSPEFERAEFACNLFGHSISNRIAHRSVIGLKEVSDWQTYFPTNEIYGVVMKNNLRTVKIVKRSKEKDGFLELIPDPKPEFNNTGYDKEDVPISFVTRFFQVVAWGCFERIAM